MEPSHDRKEISERLTVEEIVRLSTSAQHLYVSDQTRARVDQTRSALMDRVESGNARIYGFNTGFGDNRNNPTVPSKLRGQIQDNLIRSHAAGYGKPVESEVVKAALLIRAHTLASGSSGVRSELLDALVSLWNRGELPQIPSFGSVGASGDLAPLSHLALGLLDDVDNGLRFHVDGTDSVLAPKEGLALNNGTSFMAAWLALTVHELENLLWHADLACAMSMEAMCGVTDAYLEEVQDLRPHQDVRECSARILGFLDGSQLVFRKGSASNLAVQTRTLPSGVVDSTQDDYCLRSASVVHGTGWQALRSAHQVVETEVNSVTDNPVIVNGEALSGSHFHGMPLSFAADQLRTAMAIVGGISERRVAKLMNDKRNYGLPRHLVLEDQNGIKSGWMIAQYLCASLVNELKTRSMPYCVGNVTTGNESEDFVSMGANACRAAYECVEHLRGIVAVELAAATRALIIRVDWGTASSQADLLSTRAKTTIEIFEKEGIEVSHTEDRPLEPIIAQTAALAKSRTLRNRPVPSEP